MSLEAEKLFYAATQALQAGRIDDATDQLLALSTQYPAYAAGLSGLGDVFATRFKDLAQAEKYYKQAIAADPAGAAAHAGYALLLILTGRYAEANAHLNKAANIPGGAQDRVHNLFGMLHEAQAHLDEAIASYRQALLATFSDELVTACEQAIKRCETKKKYL